MDCKSNSETAAVVNGIHDIDAPSSGTSIRSQLTRTHTMAVSCGFYFAVGRRVACAMSENEII